MHYGLQYSISNFTLSVALARAQFKCLSCRILSAKLGIFHETFIMNTIWQERKKVPSLKKERNKGKSYLKNSLIMLHQEANPSS